MARLLKVPPPALPFAGPQYAPSYMDQLLKVLRLYFNRMSEVLNLITGTNGGQYIDCPNGLFFNTADQTFPDVNTAYPVVFNQTYLSNAVSVVDSSKITVSVGGVYNLQYSGQLLTSSSSAKTFYLWIRRNGTDIGFSTRGHTVDSNNHLDDVEWNFNIDLGAGEYIEIIAAKTAAGIQLEAQTATAPHPGIPSSVLSVNFIAPLPEPRPTAP
jgi:hypothetical protein